jgi:hypothetical protein
MSRAKQLLIIAFAPLAIYPQDFTTDVRVVNLYPTPVESLTCLMGLAGGGPTTGGGVFLLKQEASFFKNNTLPAIKDWGCDE